MEGVKKYTSPADMDLPANADAAAKLTEIFNAQASSAAELCKTNMVADMAIQFVNLKDLAGEVSGARLDVPELIAEVAKICPSMLDTFTWEGKYKALDLMKKIIYSIGPETRTVQKGKTPDVHWRLRIAEEVTDEQITNLAEVSFEKAANANVTTDACRESDKKKRIEVAKAWKAVPNGDGKYVTAGAILVSTFKSTNAPTCQPKLSDASNVILLTIKQATIIGLYILSKFTSVACPKEHEILTPLSGAVFSRNSLSKMMEEPSIRAAMVNKATLIDCINKSAQNGGQFLEGSRADVAAVCVLVGTQNVKKTEERKSIVQRTMKQFIAQRRPHNRDVFAALVKYGTGGLPEDWTFEALLEAQQTVSRRVTLEQSRALDQAVVNTNAGN